MNEEPLLEHIGILQETSRFYLSVCSVKRDLTKDQVIGQRINPQEERWVVCETAEKPNTQKHIPGKCPWNLQTKFPEMMVEHFQTVAMLADFFANLLQGILFKKYREIMLTVYLNIQRIIKIPGVC